MKSHATLLVAATLIVLAAQPTFAHTGAELGGLAAGLLHPVSGVDHLVAMVAVGLWGAILGAPALWVLPVLFPVLMALAGAAGAAGVPLAGVEIGIALSGIVLGLMVLFAVRLPMWAAVAMVGVFALFHGHAHGTELPSAANPLVYAIGFVVATGTLHMVGIALGLVAKWPAGRVAVRAAGAAIALAGGAFLTGVA